jgi:hypothetical protein
MGRQASDAPQGRRGHCCGHTLTLRLHALHPPQNFGCDTGNWDFKGLTSRNVTLNGAAVEVVGPMTGCDAIATSLEEAMQLQFGCRHLTANCAVWALPGMHTYANAVQLPTCRQSPKRLGSVPAGTVG